jgi:hypothetical protein
MYMKKALFALSLLVVSPLIVAEEAVVATTEVSAPKAEAPKVETPAVVEAPKVEAPVAAQTPVSQGIFSRSYHAVKNGTVNSVVFVKDGVVCVYDKVTGTIERFTPQMILNVRDSVRSLIANNPFIAVALTAFVTVKTVEYLAESSDLDEDASF